MANQSNIPVHLNFPLESLYPEKNQKLEFSTDLKIIKSYPAQYQPNCETLIHDWTKAKNKLLLLDKVNYQAIV